MKWGGWFGGGCGSLGCGSWGVVAPGQFSCRRGGSQARQFHAVSHDHAGSYRIITFSSPHCSTRRGRGLVRLWNEARTDSAAGRSLKLDDSTPSRMIMRARTGSSRVLAASLLNKARSRPVRLWNEARSGSEAGRSLKLVDSTPSRMIMRVRNGSSRSRRLIAQQGEVEA